MGLGMLFSVMYTEKSNSQSGERVQICRNERIYHPKEHSSLFLVNFHFSYILS